MMKAPPSLPLQRTTLSRIAAVREMGYSFFRGADAKTALTGPPTEFDSHKPYLPGDDTRWIDWNIYARLRDLHVKVFEVEEERDVFVFVDESLSMVTKGGKKHQLAVAAGAAVSYLALLTAHPVTVLRYAEKLLDRMGPLRNMAFFAAVQDFFLTPPQGGGTDLEKSLSPLFQRQTRPTTVVVVTDGFQTKPIEQAFAASGGGTRHNILLRVESRDDLSPRLLGNLQLHDTESDETRRFIADRTLERQLRGAVRSYFQRLEKRLRRQGVDCHVLPLGKEFEEAFIDMLRASQPARAGAAPE